MIKSRRIIIPVAVCDLPEVYKKIWEEFTSQEEKDHPIVIVDGVYRFVARELDSWIMGKINLNELFQTTIPRDDIKRLYRWSGYSLCGYMEVFYD